MHPILKQQARHRFFYLMERRKDILAQLRITRRQLASDLAAIMAICLSGCASATITHGIPNLSIVEPGIYRGGQPDAEGWAWLKSQGVSYDIKLNTWDESNDKGAFTNNICVQDDGIIDLFHQTIIVPDSYTVDSAVQSLLDCKADGGKCFVHCEHGQDRTGLIVASFRLREGWSKADAEKEMMAHGFHTSLGGLWRYWRMCAPNPYSIKRDGSNN